MIQAERQNYGRAKTSGRSEEERMRTPCSSLSEAVTIGPGKPRASEDARQGAGEDRSRASGAGLDFFDHLMRLKLLNPTAANTFLESRADRFADLLTAEQMGQ